MTRHQIILPVLSWMLWTGLGGQLEESHAQGCDSCGSTQLFWDLCGGYDSTMTFSGMTLSESKPPDIDYQAPNPIGGVGIGGGSLSVSWRNPAAGCDGGDYEGYGIVTVIKLGNDETEDDDEDEQSCDDNGNDDQDKFPEDFIVFVQMDPSGGFPQIQTGSASNDDPDADDDDLSDNRDDFGETSSPDSGSYSDNDEGFSYTASLGDDTVGEPYAGEVEYSANVGSSNAYSTSSIQYSAPYGSGVDIKYDGSMIRQLRGPDGLMDFVTLTGAEGFEQRFYLDADVGGIDSGTGLYTLNSGATSFKTIRVENPDSSGTNERIKITYIEPGEPDKAYIYSEDSSIANSQVVTNDAGLRTTTSWDSATKTETIEEYDVNRSEVLGLTEIVFDADGNKLSKTIVDPNGDSSANDNLTTIYTRYSYDEAKLESIQYPDGKWVFYEHDSADQLVEIWRSWKDVLLVNATANNAKRTQANGSVFYTDIEVETIDSSATLGTGIRTITKTRTVSVSPSLVQLVTVYVYHDDDNDELIDNKLQSVTYPDGTRIGYTYQSGDWNESTGTFSSSVSGEAILITETRGTVASPNGVANKSTQIEAVEDEEGNLVREVTRVYNGSGYDDLSTTLNKYDDQDRLIEIKKDGVVIYIADWSSDGLAQIKSEGGITMLNVYDEAGRLIKASRISLIVATLYHGGFPQLFSQLETRYEYDALNRLRKTTVDDGTSTVVTSTDYDQAGRVSSRTDRYGLVTSYAYSFSANGNRIVTQTLPNGGTIITEYYLDGQVKKITGTATLHRAYDYEYDPSTHHLTTTEAIGSSTVSPLPPRYVKTTTDMAGRTVSVERPGFLGPITEQYVYNATTGLLEKIQRTGQATQVFEYDELGRLTKTGYDDGGSGIMSHNIEETQQSYLNDAGTWYEVTKRFLYLDGVTATLVGETRQKMGAGEDSEIISIDAYGQQTVATTTRSGTDIITTVDSPTSSQDAISVSLVGLNVYNQSFTEGQPSTNDYDAHGRLQKTTDPRGAETTYAYLANGRLDYVEDDLGNRTTYTYHGQGVAGAGQVASVTQPDNTTLTYAYDLQNRVLSVGGAGTYPLSYTYDPETGEMQTLTTQGAAGSAVTTWNYHEASGLLDDKVYADGKKTDYTYDAANRLAQRIWERGVTTTYGYNDRGELIEIDYSDSTPSVDYQRNLIGRIEQVTDASGVRQLSYTDDGRLLDETYTSGMFSGKAIDRTPDAFGRVTNIALKDGAATEWSQAWNYPNGDPRLQTVTGSGVTATYAYLANSNAIESVSLNNGGGTTLVRTHGYDALTRLTSVTNQIGAGMLSSHDYAAPGQPGLDAMGRRQSATRQDGTVWSYAYNNRGEIIDAHKKIAGLQPQPGYQFGYNYDDIGNRLNAERGGDEALDSGLITDTYVPNTVNQYTSRTYSGQKVIGGEVNPSAMLEVNGERPDWRLDGLWSKLLSINNGSGPVAENVTVRGLVVPGAGSVLTQQETGTLLVPPANQVFTYDDDGNLTADGVWIYTWNGENRLIAMENVAALPETARRKLEFAYDSQGRRVSKRVYQRQSGAWSLLDEREFLYDGWNLVAETDVSGNLQSTYLWGTDVSGTGQGAGGVGGLLMISVETGPDAGDYYPAYDGNGNIMALANASDGIPVATYEYGPFGELKQASGALASANPFGFSTKYTDRESGLLYYGFRSYHPTLGRWLNRDPIEEEGGKNSYAFISNDSCNNLDNLGLRLHSGLLAGYKIEILMKSKNGKWRDETLTKKVYKCDKAIEIEVQPDGLIPEKEIPDQIPPSLYYDQSAEPETFDNEQRKIILRNVGFSPLVAVGADVIGGGRKYGGQIKPHVGLDVKGNYVWHAGFNPSGSSKRIQTDFLGVQFVPERKGSGLSAGGTLDVVVEVEPIGTRGYRNNNIPNHSFFYFWGVSIRSK